MGPADTLRHFESLGDNCEFGLVQRHFGFETSGLLKWVSIAGGTAGLIEALRRPTWDRVRRRLLRAVAARLGSRRHRLQAG